MSDRKCPKCGGEIDLAIDDLGDLFCLDKAWWHTACLIASMTESNANLVKQLAAVTQERDKAQAACGSIEEGMMLAQSENARLTKERDFANGAIIDALRTLKGDVK